MFKIINEKTLRYIAFIFALSILLTSVLRIFFDFNIKQKQIILRITKFNRFDYYAVIAPDKKKYSNLILIGLPGDTLLINKAKPYINSKNISKKFLYYFMIDLSNNSQKVSLEHFPISFIYTSFDNYYKLKKHLLILPVSQPPYLVDTNIYPYNKKILWNKDNFGPFIIPYKGLKLKLNNYTYLLYAPIIKYYENTEIVKKGKHFFINNRKSDIYTFKNDYYFFLNKNLYITTDSRQWGPLTRKKIIGKVIKMPKWLSLFINLISNLSL